VDVKGQLRMEEKNSNLTMFVEFHGSRYVLFGDGADAAQDLYCCK